MEIYVIELLGSMSADEAWLHYVRYIFIRSTITYREYAYKNVCNDSSNIPIVMGSQACDARNTEIWVYAFYMLNVAQVKNDVKWRPIVTKFGTLIDNMSRTGLYQCHIF